MFSIVICCFISDLICCFSHSWWGYGRVFHDINGALSIHISGIALVLSEWPSNVCVQATGIYEVSWTHDVTSQYSLPFLTCTD